MAPMINDRYLVLNFAPLVSLDGRLRFTMVYVIL